MQAAHLGVHIGLLLLVKLEVGTGRSRRRFRGRGFLGRPANAAGAGVGKEAAHGGLHNAAARAQEFFGDAGAEAGHIFTLDHEVARVGIRQGDGVGEIDQLSQALGELPVRDLHIAA
mgnify:CR=1 FL=1